MLRTVSASALALSLCLGLLSGCAASGPDDGGVTDVVTKGADGSETISSTTSALMNTGGGTCKQPPGVHVWSCPVGSYDSCIKPCQDSGGCSYLCKLNCKCTLVSSDVSRSSPAGSSTVAPIATGFSK